MNDKKLREQKCFDITRDYVATRIRLKTRKYINSLVPINDTDFLLYQSERPDFYANFGNYSYAIEHFIVDFCNDGPSNDQAESQRVNHELSVLFNKYHDPSIGTIKDSDIPNATIDIDKELNRILNISLSFNYDKYIESFSRSFNHHYSHIDDYLTNKALSNNNTRIGFIIEFHCDTTLMHAIKNNEHVTFQSKHKPFPLTKDIYKLIESANKLDFVIITQFNEVNSSEAQDVRIYEPRNMKQSIDSQNITIYDSIYYENYRKNIEFNIIHN